MRRAAIFLVLAALVYPLALASFHPWNLAIGALVAAAALAAFRRHLVPEGLPPLPSLGRRLLWFAPFLAAAAWEVALGTWQVALVVLGVRPLRRPGIVAVPIGERTPSGVVTFALVSTLSPGEVVVDVDAEREEILVHVIDASDPDAVRERHDRLYRRFQRHVFP